MEGRNGNKIDKPEFRRAKSAFRYQDLPFIRGSRVALHLMVRRRTRRLQANLSLARGRMEKFRKNGIDGNGIPNLTWAGWLSRVYIYRCTCCKEELTTRIQKMPGIRLLFTPATFAALQRVVRSQNVSRVIEQCWRPMLWLYTLTWAATRNPKTWFRLRLKQGTNITILNHKRLCYSRSTR